MKAMLISFAVGLLVGIAYALLRVKSPAPPLVALAGLLGMVWGEQVARDEVEPEPHEHVFFVQEIFARDWSMVERTAQTQGR